MMRRSACTTVAAALAALAAAPGTAGAADLNLRLQALEGREPLTTTVVPGYGVGLPEGLRLVAEGRALELQAVRRPDGTVGVEQAERGAGGAITWRPTALGARSMATGIAGFVRLRLRRDGRTVLDQRVDLCPNTFARPREGTRRRRAARAFPLGCGYLLSRRVPWGLPADSTIELAYTGVVPSSDTVRPGTYDATITVDPDRHLAQTTRADDAVRVRLRVQRPRRGRRGVIGVNTALLAARAQVGARAAAEPAPAPAPAPAPGVPLPDLVAIPSAAVALRDGMLSFDAMVANLGPAPLVVRGPRTAGRRATQLFTVGGRTVGSRPVGTLEFARGHSHRHWHFHDLARYRIRDAAGKVVVRSPKVGFCFMNTHPVDVRLGDPATPSAPDQTKGCGLRGLQRIDAGWGDLYSLGYDGQSLDVSDLPPGDYAVEISVDAGRRLSQVTRANDVAQRPFRLVGRGSRQRLVLPPIEGVDTAALDEDVLPFF